MSGALMIDDAKVSARKVTRPELLAPAGDRDCLVAAIENGADAVYFGLQGHNARARAANFRIEELTEVMALLHRRGVRGYVTLNTLIFPGELPGVEVLVRRIAKAGADALIVQDVGLCRLIRAITPDLEIHASTQMSITSADGVRMAQELGCSRVILARELSLTEIARLRAEVALPVEVFVHGALCVAYSGQCLTSEALGARSANRGECAQACRLPYQIVCDGRDVDLGDVRYLLSPQDLAAFDHVPKLVELGVASLKIEGRLKSPEYVASITASYRRAIDAACGGRPAGFTRGDIEQMEMTFSRGFSHGFFDGTNHKALVRGDYAKKRGLFLGRIAAINGSRVRLDLAAPIKPGDGVVFDGDESAGVPEQGGRVYEVRRPGSGRRAAEGSEARGLSAGPAELGFGHRDLDVRKLRVGQRAWKTDDPDLTRRLRATFEGTPRRTVDLHVEARAVVGEPLVLSGRTDTGFAARVASDEPLRAAERLPTKTAELRAQLGRLGGTIYRLATLEAALEGGPLVPRSVANGLRRSLVEALDDVARRQPERMIADAPALPALRQALWARRGSTDAATLTALCRTTPQALAAAASGAPTILLDYQDIKAYPDAVAALRAAAPGVAVFLAPPRIEKPGESPIFAKLAKQGADGLLARNAGAVRFCAGREIPYIADFSLNAANELSAEWFLALGALRVTASYDLSIDQLDGLARAMPPGLLEVVIHQHMPMFHMEHCVYCAFLSPGTGPSDCGRPCDHHDVRLRDRVGMEHPLRADVGCRNTLFHAVPQSAAEYLPRLRSLGVRHFRVEFLDESPEAVARTLPLYAGALADRRDARGLWRELKATNRYGVTRGQLAVID